MRTLTRILLASSGAALAVLSTAPAVAQSGIHLELPNVLLLVDNSGSMEYLTSPAGKLPGDASAPNTACNGHNNLAAMNRWATLVTALTGSIQANDFSCWALDRHTAAFAAEYGEGGIAPYDANYYLPFNRIYSNNCSYGAGTLGANWDWWNLPSASGQVDFQWHQQPDGGHPEGQIQGACDFHQSGDGILDTFRGLVRFGMMTLDSFPNPGTGSTVTGTPSNAIADPPSAEKGMWSYFHHWIGGPGAAPVVEPQPPPTPIGGAGAGNPAGCPTASWFEVGARNQSAPPWEGRLVPFGNWASDLNVPTNNDQIQLELLTSRPYGATPIAALLDDAKEFLFGDNTPVPPTNTWNFGPTDDQYWSNGCRKTSIILMTDGMDNMDLRSHTLKNAVGGLTAFNGCDTAGSPAGACPYLPADQIASHLLLDMPSQSVLTYVVGFTVATISQLGLTPAQLPASGAATCDLLTVADCAAPANPLKACCELNKIAVAGGTGHAYFADASGDYKPALSGILSQIVQGTANRTTPVYAPGGNHASQGMSLIATPSAEYQFTASFNVTASAPSPGPGPGPGPAPAGGLWTGSLYRGRYACIAGVPTQQDPTTAASANLGDDYALNLDNTTDANPRNFFTVIGADADNGHGGGDHIINSDYTIRPYIGTDDNFGTYAPDPAAPITPQLRSSFPLAMSNYPGAFAADDADCNGDFHQGNHNQCIQDLVNWEVGLNNALDPAATFQTRDYSHCPSACPQGPTACACRQLGAIFHSTPAVVGPPVEAVRDDTYTNYANLSTVAGQETMLYTATMDGQLHAFKVQAGNTNPDTFFTDHLANNERWSFLPARVLQHILPNYNSNANLLDGIPVIADVPGQIYNLTTSTNPPVLQRSGTDQVGWHRVLVSSGGPAGGFYYALEITDPENPHFLWQVSTDAIGTPIFGSSTPTAAIAIVNLSIPAGTPPIQVPIAILPGGATGSLIPGCDPTLQSVPAANSIILANDPSNQHLLPGVNPAPPPLRCWDMSKNATRSSGNSLTIVRLDTGRVLAHFVGQGYSGAPHNGSGADHGGDDGHGGDDNHEKESINSNVYDAPFRAPLSGTPVPYPGQTGAVSDRVYVGDADGLLWRVDMSNPDITQWGASIMLAWDSYLDDTTAQREALGPPPIVSRDPIGNPVLLIASGDQDTFTTEPTSNHVWSLTENPATIKVSPNWDIRMPGGGAGGARVTGPMALFNSALYFASFLPAAGANVCSNGTGSIWAVDYLRRGAAAVPAGGTPAAMNPVVGVWPAPAYPTATPGTYLFGADGAPGTIIMGVAVSQTPTCDSTGPSTDPYFGAHSSVSGSSGSSYQISWQTGGGKGLSGGPVQANGPGSQSITPPPPGRGTRIDSWASVVE